MIDAVFDYDTHTIYTHTYIHIHTHTHTHFDGVRKDGLRQTTLKLLHLQISLCAFFHPHFRFLSISLGVYSLMMGINYTSYNYRSQTTIHSFLCVVVSLNILYEEYHSCFRPPLLEISNSMLFETHTIYSDCMPTCVCEYVCEYVCMYVCVYVFIVHLHMLEREHNGQDEISNHGNIKQTAAIGISRTWFATRIIGLQEIH